MRIVFGSIAILVVSACSSAPEPQVTTGNTVDPLIIAALPGAEGDGPAEIGLTEEAAVEEGFAPLSGEEIYASLAGNTLISRWRSGRIIERQHHRPSGLRLDDVDFSTLDFTNGVTTMWYVDENGDYCEANVSRRNCGPMFAMDRQFVWFNSAEAEGALRRTFLAGSRRHSTAGPWPCRP